MRAEILEVPDVVADLLGRVAPAAEGVAAAFGERRPQWLTIAARGTSDHAAVYARYLFETLLGLPTGLAAPSVVTTYRAPLRWRGGAVVAISQSGQSPDVVEFTAAARAGGALTIAITNEAESPLAAAAEQVVLCHAGAEAAIPATKTYVTTLVAIAAIVTTIGDADLARRLPRLPDVLAVALERSVRWLADQPEPDSVVAAVADAGRALVVSRGYNLATALEVGLKLKETAGIFAEPYSAADLLHGPLILADRAVPTIIIRPGGAIATSIDAASELVRARGGRTWQISSGTAPTATGLSLSGDLPEALTPIPYVLPGYLIAEAVAQRRGLDPDSPAGLAKITHTR